MKILIEKGGVFPPTVFFRAAVVQHERVPRRIAKMRRKQAFGTKEVPNFVEGALPRSGDEISLIAYSLHNRREKAFRTFYWASQAKLSDHERSESKERAQVLEGTWRRSLRYLGVREVEPQDWGFDARAEL